MLLDRTGCSTSQAQLRATIRLALAISCAPGVVRAQTAVQRGTQQYSRVISYRNTSPGVTYVGSKACAACHADIYATYIQTDMGRSMSEAGSEAGSQGGSQARSQHGSSPPEPAEPTSPAGSQAGSAGENVTPDPRSTVTADITIHDAKLNRYFQVQRRGSDLYQSEYELAADGSEVFRTTQKLEYVIGSGANGRGYIVRRGDYLFEAPLSYYSKSKSWALSPGYEFGDYGFSRTIAAECLACHSGLAEPVPGREGRYRDPPFRELAIGCENCHGPGQLHIEERTRGVPVIGGVDTAIVNPAKLAGWLADNICVNCHQGGDMKVPQPGKTYFDFRPGTPLENTVAIFAVPIRRESPPSSPLLQHYWSMILSKCYGSSAGRMSCVSCHDPHVQPSDAASYYRKRCLTCHDERSCSLPLALRARKNPPDDCAGCHMPKQNLPEIAHAALTNHRIIAHDGEPYPEIAYRQSTPELPDLVHLDPIPGAKEAIPPLTLLQVYGGLLHSHPEYRPRYLALLHSLAESDRGDPQVLSGLAWEKLTEGKPEGAQEAMRYLPLAIQAGSTAAGDYESLVNLLTRAGRISEGIAIADRGLQLNPYDARLYKTKALLHISAHEYPQALAAMKKELELFPQDDLMRALVKKAESAPVEH